MRYSSFMYSVIKYGLITTGAVGFIAIAACGDDDTNGSGSGSSGKSSSGASGRPCNGIELHADLPDGGRPGCTGLACNVVDCADGVKTTLTGKVFDPAGKVPIYNATVYVPNGELKPITAGLGATCDRCDSTDLSNPIAVARTDATDAFTPTDIPANADFTIVMPMANGAAGDRSESRQLPNGHRRRGNHAPPAQLPGGRYSANRAVDGLADPLECLLRKIGLEDSEFGIAGSPARVHLFKAAAPRRRPPPLR